MSEKYVLNFDDVVDEFDSTYELVPPPVLTSDGVPEESDAALLRALARFSASADGTVGSEYRFRAECQHVSSSQAPANDDTDWFEGILKINA